MSKRSLSLALGAFTVAWMSAGVAFADCPGHSTESAQTATQELVLKATPPAPPATPAPETKTGG